MTYMGNMRALGWEMQNPTLCSKAKQKKVAVDIDVPAPPTLPSVESPPVAVRPLNVTEAEPPKADGAGKKYDTGKVRTDLLPAGAIRQVDWVFRDETIAGSWNGFLDEIFRWRRTRYTDHLARATAELLTIMAPSAAGRSCLLPYAGPALLDVAAVLTFGAAKYGPNNWQGLTDFDDRYYAAILRHVFALGTGEEIDPESGLPHLAHAACGLLFLLSRAVGHDPC